jgi:exodeoxyribonuclease VIII
MVHDLTHHPGLTNEAYHELEAVSPSRIKVLRRSPFHYYDQFIAEDRVKKPPTASMLKGTALHTAILEPDLWDATIAVPPHTFDRRTKVGRERAEAFEAESAGRIVITPDDADEVRYMADAVQKHPAARFVLELPGRREASYTWSDQPTSLKCKSRPDWHSLDGRIVLDVKTAEDASREAFAKIIANLDYHVQAAWNLDAQGGERFLSLVVENTRPYGVAVYPASAAMLAAGRRRISSAMEQLAECWRTGVWPGYGDLIGEDIELPGWCRD